MKDQDSSLKYEMKNLDQYSALLLYIKSQWKYNMYKYHYKKIANHDSFLKYISLYFHALIAFIEEKFKREIQKFHFLYVACEITLN